MAEIAPAITAKIRCTPPTLNIETGEQEEINDKGDVEDKEELHDEISQDMIEEERRKAHKKREYVKELKARIERIQKEKEEKIAKVKNGKSEEK